MLEVIETRQFGALGINEGVEEITKIYYQIAVKAEQLVNESYAEQGKKVRFPIDVNLLA